MKQLGVWLGIGWASIIALAWALADRRVLLCGQESPYSDGVATRNHISCVMRAVQTRDDVLVWGAIVALAVAGVIGAWHLLQKKGRPEERP